MDEDKMEALAALRIEALAGLLKDLPGREVWGVLQDVLEGDVLDQLVDAVKDYDAGEHTSLNRQNVVIELPVGRFAKLPVEVGYSARFLAARVLEQILIMEMAVEADPASRNDMMVSCNEGLWGFGYDVMGHEPRWIGPTLQDLVMHVNNFPDGMEGEE